MLLDKKNMIDFGFAKGAKIESVKFKVGGGATIAVEGRFKDFEASPEFVKRYNPNKSQHLIQLKNGFMATINSDLFENLVTQMLESELDKTKDNA